MKKNNIMIIIGNPNSIYIKNEVENVYNNLTKKIVLIMTTKNNNKIFYKKKNIKTVLIGSIAYRLFIIGNAIKLFIKQNDSTLWHFNSINSTTISILKQTVHENSRVIVSYWGSDILRDLDGDIKQYDQLITVFTMSSISCYRKFIKKYPKISKSKIKILHFANGNCSMILEMKSKVTKSNAKRRFGISQNDVLISIGYNGKEAQQHIQVLDTLSELTIEEKNSIYVVLQLNGATSEYIDKLTEMLNKSSIKYNLILNYLSDYDNNLLRIASDIFINNQVTDAFCSAVREYICAGALIVNSSSVHYEELSNFSNIHEFKDYKELKNIISQYIQGKIKYVESNNEEKLFRYSDTIMCEKWIDFFKVYFGDSNE